MALFIDEMQSVDDRELASLIAAFHRMAQRNLPVTMVGAGLPEVRSRAGKAKSYAERVMELPEIGALSPTESVQAISRPLAEEGVAIYKGACAAVAAKTEGYPHFLQEWGKAPRGVAEESPITAACLDAASQLPTPGLDESFFLVRFERFTPAERRYLSAMAHLGPGPRRSAAVPDRLQRKVTQLAPVRNRLINKAMVWSPGYGDIAFTVPMFDEFLRRIMARES